MKKLLTLLMLGAVLSSHAAIAGGVYVNEGFEIDLGVFSRFRSAGFDPMADANSDTNSGGAFINTVDSNFSSISTRINLADERPLSVNFDYRVSETGAGFSDPVRVMAQFLGPECISSTQFVLQNDIFFLQAEDAEWYSSDALEVVLPTPAQAACVTLLFRIGNPDVVSEIFVDNIVVQPLDNVLAKEIIFDDSYE